MHNTRLFLSDLLHNGGRSAFILNRGLYCICSENDIIQSGECLRDFLCDNCDIAVGEKELLSLYRNGEFFCASLRRITTVDGEIFYLGEIISRREAQQIYHRTHRLSDAVPLLGGLDDSISELWQTARTLSPELSRPIYKLMAAKQRIFEYLDLSDIPTVNVVVDIKKYFSRLASRFNETISKSGRRLSLQFSDGTLYIRADFRKAAAAFSDIIQLALVNAPRDSAINVSITRTENDSGSFVVISLDLPFGINHGGDIYGHSVSYAERFASSFGGSLELTDSIILTLPEATAEDMAVCRLEETDTVIDPDYPDVVDIKMFELSELFESF